MTDTTASDSVTLRPTAAMSLGVLIPLVVGLITGTAWFYATLSGIRAESDLIYQRKAQHEADLAALRELHANDIEHVVDKVTAADQRIEEVNQARFEAVMKTLTRIEDKMEK
jgi:translation initiation factor 2B subunit (eIF-2B alpha/beta/delta family)